MVVNVHVSRIDSAVFALSSQTYLNMNCKYGRYYRIVPSIDIPNDSVINYKYKVLNNFDVNDINRCVNKIELYDRIRNDDEFSCIYKLILTIDYMCGVNMSELFLSGLENISQSHFDYLFVNEEGCSLSRLINICDKYSSTFKRNLIINLKGNSFFIGNERIKECIEISLEDNIVNYVNSFAYYRLKTNFSGRKSFLSSYRIHASKGDLIRKEADDNYDFGRLLEIYDILESNIRITKDLLNEVVIRIPGGLTSRLRICLDEKLSSRLSHLFEVLRYLKGDIYPNYKVISVEGLSNQYFNFDYDLIVENENNELIVCDLTSNPMLYEKKKAVLDSNVEDNSLISGSEVIIFNPKRFLIDIQTNCDKDISAISTFNFLYSAIDKDSLWKENFINKCEEIYEEACSEIVGSSYEKVNKNYRNYDVTGLDFKLIVEALRNNNFKSFNIFANLKNKFKFLDIYHETCEKIKSNVKPNKYPFKVGIPKCSNHNYELGLWNLRQNVIMKTIYHCYKSKRTVGGYNNRDKTFFFPTNEDGFRGSSPFLDENLEYDVLAKHIKGSVFKLKFKKDIMDDNFALFNDRKENYNDIIGIKKGKIDRIREEYAHKSINVVYNECEVEMDRLKKELLTDGFQEYYSSVFGKVDTLSSMYSNDMNDIGKKAAKMTRFVAKTLNSSKIGAMISHEYEIAKTFAASIKSTPKKNLYYVGQNGDFDSFTLTRMNCTQDSFSNASYFTIYRNDFTPRNISDKFKSERDISNGDLIYQTKTRTFNKNTLSHELKIPFELISLITWEVESRVGRNYEMDSNEAKDIIMSSILHLKVNKDTFAQASEQCRYLYTSNIGYGASSADICSKIDFIQTSSIWEILYLFRMIKMGALLQLAHLTNKMGEVSSDGDILVAFPHSKVKSPTFNHTISSMYYCNIYNKFRAFHEVSESICYNELIDENNIYIESLNEYKYELLGISEISVNRMNDMNYFISDEFVLNEGKFVRKLIKSGSKRFQGSIFVQIFLAHSEIKLDEADIKNIYKSVNESPIEACTMRGAMESGVSKSKGQAVRASSSILEELTESVGITRGSGDRANNMMTMIDLTVRQTDFSLYNIVLRQDLKDVTYRYRIVQKDQKGHREISVLNAKFRIGAMFVENISKSLSHKLEEDVLENPSKDIIIENSIRSLLKQDGDNTLISDNSDQKRWGPNQLLHMFAATFFGIFKDNIGLFKMILRVLINASDKRVKFPESILTFIKNHGFVSGSETIQRTLDLMKPKFEVNEFEQKLEWGMCQGIFHSTSSMIHALSCRMVSDCLRRKHGNIEFTMKSFVTSDDAERLILVKEKIENRISFCRSVHNIVEATGCVTNILRNNSKSSFSFHVSEFNSIFYKKFYLATPTLKQRISKIDIGEGSNPFEDMLSALSNPMGYLSAGGSYTGTVIMTILNLCMHTEQWNRWIFVKEGIFNRLVEFGGFPVIEPLSTMFCGPASNFYLRGKDLIKREKYSQLIIDSSMEELQSFKLSEFMRVSDSSNLNYLNDVSIVKSAGTMGLFSLDRTDKKLSQFERRHEMSKWIVPNWTVNLKKHDSRSDYFAFNVLSATSTSYIDDSKGVNSFFIRYTDPWVNADRDVFRCHDKSVFGDVIGIPKGNFSINTMRKTLLDISDDEYNSRIKYLIDRPEGKKNIVRAKFEVLLDDSESLFNDIGNINAGILEPRSNINKITKIGLSGQTSLDRVEFKLSLIKTYAEEDSRIPIIKYTRDSTNFENIAKLGEYTKLNIKEAVRLSDNVSMAYDKYLKKHTKLITTREREPDSLREVAVMILEDRITERYGMKKVIFNKLNTDRYNLHAKIPWYSELSKRVISEKTLIEDFILKNVDKTREKVKIYSNDSYIDKYNEFNLVKVGNKVDLVRIEARDFKNFIELISLFSRVDSRFILDKRIHAMLFSESLLPGREFFVDRGNYVRNCTNKHLSVKVNNSDVMHFVRTIVDNDSVRYEHYFVSDSRINNATVSSIVNTSYNVEGWASSLSNQINRIDRVSSGIKYGTAEDSIEFVEFKNTDSFEIISLEKNLSTFIKLNDVNLLIPIFNNLTSQTEIKGKGYKIDKIDFNRAFEKLQKIEEDIDDVEDENSDLSKIVNFIICETSYDTPLSHYKKKFRGNDDFNFNTREEIDILRGFLISSIAGIKEFDKTRIEHYYMNLFNSSVYYKNGIIKVALSKRFCDPVIPKEDLTIADHLIPVISENDIILDERIYDFDENRPVFDNTDVSNDLLITGIDEQMYDTEVIDIDDNFDPNDGLDFDDDFMNLGDLSSADIDKSITGGFGAFFNSIGGAAAVERANEISVEEIKELQLPRNERIITNIDPGVKTAYKIKDELSKISRKFAPTKRVARIFRTSETIVEFTQSLLSMNNVRDPYKRFISGYEFEEVDLQVPFSALVMNEILTGDLS